MSIAPFLRLFTRRFSFFRPARVQGRSGSSCLKTGSAGSFVDTAGFATGFGFGGDKTTGLVEVACGPGFRTNRLLVKGAAEAALGPGVRTDPNSLLAGGATAALGPGVRTDSDSLLVGGATRTREEAGSSPCRRSGGG